MIGRNKRDQLRICWQQYGFILRFPEGKEDIPEDSYEPWHIRYIDDPAKAEEITSKGLTLEEYLGEAQADNFRTNV